MTKRRAAEGEAIRKRHHGEERQCCGRSKRVEEGGCGICGAEVRNEEERFWKSEKLLCLINLEEATPCLSHPTFWMSLTDAYDTLCPMKILQLTGGPRHRKLVYLLSLADETCLKRLREELALSVARRLENILRTTTSITEALQTLASLLVTVARSFPRLGLTTFCVRGIQSYLTTLRRAVGAATFADSQSQTPSYRIAPNQLLTDVVGLLASDDDSIAQLPPSEVQHLIDSLIFLSPNFPQLLKSYTITNNPQPKHLPQILHQFTQQTAAFPFPIFLRLNSHLLHTFIYALKYIASLPHSQQIAYTLPLANLQRQHLPASLKSQTKLHLVSFNNAFWFRIAEQDGVNFGDECSVGFMEELKAHVDMVDSMCGRLMGDMSGGEVDWLLKEMALLCVICLEMIPSVRRYGWDLLVKWSRYLDGNEFWRSGMSGALNLNRVCWFVREVLLCRKSWSESLLSAAEEMFYFCLRGELAGLEEELSGADTADCATPLLRLFIKTILRRPPIESSFASEWISYKSEILNLKLDFSFLKPLPIPTTAVLSNHLPIFQSSQVNHFNHLDDLQTSALLHQIATTLPCATAAANFPAGAPSSSQDILSDRKKGALKAQMVVAAILTGRETGKAAPPTPLQDFVGAMLKFLTDSSTTSHYQFFPFIVQQLLRILVVANDLHCPPQPSTSDSRRQPSTSDSRRQPSTSDSRRESSTSDSRRQPSTSDSRRQPSTSDSRRESSTSDSRQPSVPPLPLSLKVDVEKIGLVLIHLCPTSLLQDSFLPFTQLLAPQHLHELIKGWQTYLDALDETLFLQPEQLELEVDKNCQDKTQQSSLETWIDQRYSTLKKVFKLLQDSSQPHSSQPLSQPIIQAQDQLQTEDPLTAKQEDEEQLITHKTSEVIEGRLPEQASQQHNRELRQHHFPTLSNELNPPPTPADHHHQEDNETKMLEGSWKNTGLHHLGHEPSSTSTLSGLSQQLVNASKFHNYNPSLAIQLLNNAMSLLKNWRSRTVDRTTKIHRALPYWRRTRPQFTTLLESICQLIDRINISTFKPYYDHANPATQTEDQNLLLLPLLEACFAFIINLCHLPRSQSKEIVRDYLNFCVYANSAWINQMLAASVHLYTASTHNAWLRVRVAHYWVTWIRIVGSDKMYKRLFRSGLSRVGIVKKFCSSEVVLKESLGEEELFEYASQRMDEVLSLVQKKHA